MRGTSQITSNARASASVTPSPAHSAPTRPITSAVVLPVSGSTSSRSCAPITGIRPNAESRTSSCSDGSSSSTKPSTETSTSSSGKIEKNA